MIITISKQEHVKNLQFFSIPSISCKEISDDDSGTKIFYFFWCIIGSLKLEYFIKSATSKQKEGLKQSEALYVVLLPVVLWFMNSAVWLNHVYQFYLL